jgi:hypothetical protein
VIGEVTLVIVALAATGRRMSSQSRRPIIIDTDSGQDGRVELVADGNQTVLLRDNEMSFLLGEKAFKITRRGLFGPKYQLWFGNDLVVSLAQTPCFNQPARVQFEVKRSRAKTEANLPIGQRIDFISIVTPNHLHLPVAKQFLEAGINVVCDKPMTFSLEEVLALRDIVKRTGKVFVLTHNYTGYPMVKEARKLVRRGTLVHRVRGSLSDWFNAIIRILNSPAEGSGGFVVLLDVTDQLSG